MSLTFLPKDRPTTDPPDLETNGLYADTVGFSNMDLEETHDADKDGMANDLQEKTSDLEYGIIEDPPWYTCIGLGFQHYISMYLGGLSVPILISSAICMGEDNLAKTELIGTTFFTCSLATFLQVLWGSRLPIVQVSTFALLSPTLAFLRLPQWTCPVITNDIYNATINDSVILVGSEEHKAVWAERLNVINGSLMVASLFEILLGLTGAIGFLLRYIGPLCICPTISLLGVSLFRATGEYCGKQWWIAITVVVVIAVLSQYIPHIKIPCFSYNSEKKSCYRTNYPLFKMFPVILATLLVWMLCAILTVTNVFPNTPGEWGYEARTDTRAYVLTEAPWFYFPYPGQWGMPTVSISLVLGMMAGLLASIVESIGDYYACAALAGASPPPNHAVNRGIMMEGVSCLLSGAFGSANGTTSNSTNIAVISLTKVSSRRVILYAAATMLFFSIFNKFGALFTTIPDPIIGGAFIVLFGLIVAVGISNLQHVNMHSSRNIFVFGFSFFFGLTLPEWLISHPNAINTGSDVADTIFSVLLGTNMFVGGIVAFILDNTIKGTKEERGLASLSAKQSKETPEPEVVYTPIGFKRLLRKCNVSKFLKICPNLSTKQDVNGDELKEYGTMDRDRLY